MQLFPLKVFGALQPNWKQSCGLCVLVSAVVSLLSAAEASEQRKCISALNNGWTPYCGWKSEDVALDALLSRRSFAA